jgi:putative nucleotidyltransferase with HDIG domain
MEMPVVRIVCQSGPFQGQAFKLKPGRNTIGRDPSCEISIDDPKVSRLHAILTVQGDTVSCLDNHSTNGVYLNGRALTPDSPTPVGPDDILVIGGCEYILTPFAEYPTVHFAREQPKVTHVIQSDVVAKKFAAALNGYEKGALETRKDATQERARMRRLMRSLDVLYKMSKRIASVMPPDQLFLEMRDMLFEVFRDAENLLILIWDEEREEFVPRLVSNARGESEAPILIPHSVFHRALRERVTLLANDATHDDRFSNSNSIIGLSVQSLMCAPLLLGDRTLGALYIDNRSHIIRFEEADAELLTAFASQAAVAIDNARLCDDLQRSYHQTLQALVKTIEAKDQYTSGHSQRVAQYSRAIGEELGLDAARLELLQAAAELHDIGKIGIKERIINKTERLSDTEFHEIKNHVVTGEQILKPITYLAPVLSAIRSHHERWDGKGYPDGLKGEKIGLEARIVCVADAFDAMTTQRAYNKPMTFAEAAEKLRAASGTQFDTQVVEAFSRRLKKADFQPAAFSPITA